MYRTLIVYDWPYSQLCAECYHSELFEQGVYSMICGVNCKLSNGETCPMFLKNANDIGEDDE